MNYNRQDETHKLNVKLDVSPTQFIWFERSLAQINNPTSVAKYGATIHQRGDDISDRHSTSPSGSHHRSQKVRQFTIGTATTKKNRNYFRPTARKIHRALGRGVRATIKTWKGTVDTLIKDFKEAIAPPAAAAHANRRRSNYATKREKQKYEMSTDRLDL